MPDETPDEYSRPASAEPCLVTVPQEVYDRIAASKNGVRMWQHELPRAEIRRI
jgi:hypothetical protein